MKKKLNKIAKDTNNFLKKYLKSQKNTDLMVPMKYGLLPGGKKIRSKILIDVGKIFNTKYNTLIQIGAAVECIHAYSLIHDDLPCMDNDSLRRGKLSTHKKFGESTAILAGNSLSAQAFIRACKLLPSPEIITAIFDTPDFCSNSDRIFFADKSGFLGSRVTVSESDSTFEESIPAFAHTKPCSVSTISMPRSGSERTIDRLSMNMSSINLGSFPLLLANDLAIIDGVTSFNETILPSDLDTIFCVTTITSCLAMGVSCNLVARRIISEISSPFLIA